MFTFSSLYISKGLRKREHHHHPHHQNNLGHREFISVICMSFDELLLFRDCEIIESCRVYWWCDGTAYLLYFYSNIENWYMYIRQEQCIQYLSLNSVIRKCNSVPFVFTVDYIKLLLCRCRSRLTNPWNKLTIYWALVMRCWNKLSMPIQVFFKFNIKWQNKHQENQMLWNNITSPNFVYN